MNILGISAFYHDSAAAILQDNTLVAAVQEERFTRQKQDASFPSHAIQYCLDYTGLSIDDLDAVVFYDKPFLKFERLLDTYYAFAPKGLRSFIAAMPVWMTQKLHLKQIIKRELAKLQDYDKSKLKLLFPEHHLSHAASAFYPSNFKRAAILTIDGVGEWATTTIGLGEGRNITVLKELHFPHSVGLLYSAFTYFLGFKVNSGEYKLMGLAPYGQHNSDEVKTFENSITSELIDLKTDGSIWLNQAYFNYAVGLTMIYHDKWATLFGFEKRIPEHQITQQHCNLALAIQNVTETIVCNMAKEAKRLTNAEYLCMAGGVALNCVANGRLRKLGLFKDIFIQPAAGDAGGALGAALAAKHIYFEQERIIKTGILDTMQGSYLGPEYSDLDIRRLIRKYKPKFQYYNTAQILCKTVAALLQEGHIVGWMQGRMEFGPRALGARSILADPRQVDMQKRLNLEIKFRESFRPFAPSVLAEDVSDYFDFQGYSPYMLFVDSIKEEHRLSLPSNYEDLLLLDKLYVQRSTLPAITHVDFSARIQTVHQETNPKYHLLLSEFKALTGCSILVNTSFNVRGEPIVCSPEDAFHCFTKTGMDYLVIGNFVFEQ